MVNSGADRGVATDSDRNSRVLGAGQAIATGERQISARFKPHPAAVRFALEAARGTCYESVMYTIGSFELSEAEVLERKAYLELTPADEQRLREVHPLLQEHADEIIDQFYSYLLAHTHTRKMLMVPGLIDRLKGLQRKYFAELTSGDYGIEYFENRLRVGEAHHRIGLSPEWYLGAYVKYLHIASDVLARVFPRDINRFYRTLVSLTKVIYLDTGLALDAYHFRAQEDLSRKNVALESSNLEMQRLQAARQQLSDMIVHDLQNPLAGIEALLKTLAERRGGLSEVEQGMVEEALRRCNDLAQMITNVLHISRAEAGKLETYVENVDLARLVRDVAVSHALVAGIHGQRLRAEAPETCVVRTDESLVQRMLMNLLRNAIRHTPRGTSVVLRLEASPGAATRICVEDDGPGIAPEIQPHLFEPYGMASLKGAGIRVDTGLGLAFCRVAAQALGIGLSVESDGKKGCRFVMRFP